MERLNADCLIQIFLKLDLNQKISLERVCKRWFRILRSQRPYSNIQQLNIVDYMRHSDLNYFQQENLNFVPTIIGLLTRCGVYLRQLRFGSAWYRVSLPITATISEYCGQLTDLDLSCTILSSDISPILERIAPQLNYFSIEESNLIVEENVERIGFYFKRMKALKNINLRKCRINMNYILDLPEQLEYADISGIHHLQPELITAFLKGHSNIRGLTMNPFPGAQFSRLNLEDPTNGLDTILNCIASMPKLEHLNLGYIFCDNLTSSLSSLSKLTQLRSLELKECSDATDHCLKEILINATQLESLAIVNCAKIRNFSAINLCRNLRQFTVEKSCHICDEDFKTQTQLEKLKLKQCLNITNNTAYYVATHCPLKELDLSYCNGIDDSLFEILCTTSTKLEKLLLDGCKITCKGVSRMCLDDKLLQLLVELDLSHNKYITNECVENLIGTVDKLKQIELPTKIYLSQTSVQPEYFQNLIVGKQLELIF